MKRRRRKTIVLAIILIVIIAVGLMVFIYFYNRPFDVKKLSGPYKSVNHSFEIDAIPCEYVSEGESRDFKVKCLMNHSCELNIDDFYINSVSADKKLKKVAENEYVLSLENIHYNELVQECVPDFIIDSEENEGKLVCEVGINDDKAYAHTKNKFETETSCQFYIVESYNYISSDIKRNIFTGELQFDITYGGDVDFSMLTNRSIGFTGFHASVEIYKYPEDENTFRIVLKNISESEPNKYNIYVAGGTTSSKNGPLTESFHNSINMSKELEQKIFD